MLAVWVIVRPRHGPEELAAPIELRVSRIATLTASSPASAPLPIWISLPGGAKVVKPFASQYLSEMKQTVIATFVAVGAHFSCSLRSSIRECAKYRESIDRSLESRFFFLSEARHHCGPPGSQQRWRSPCSTASSYSRSTIISRNSTPREVAGIACRST